ncbi:MAG TPA: WecB/TagA/CpsF family glycosyltransferase [bacterium]|nr:WecB/TagA/CpsF family glycosyltransferase [bacterium]
MSISGDTTEILGIKISTLTLAKTEQAFFDFMKEGGKSLLATPNVEFIMKAQKDKGFKKILNEKSRLNLPDGFGMLWAARFLSLSAPGSAGIKQIIILLQWLGSIILIPFAPGFFKKPIPEKISGADFVWNIAKIAAKNKYRIFLLGGAPTVAERAALKLQTDIIDLRIAGVHSGTPEQSREIVEAVNRSKADILLVAFGAPKQEKWLAQYLDRTCAKVGIGVGGTFNFIAGTKQRAPKWMRESGLEWFHRLIIEPSRIRRQLAIPKFMWLVLLDKVRRK